MSAKDDNMRALLFGMVMQMCRSLDMTEAQALKMFHPDNIKGGYAILNERKDQP